ncbi:acyltransferase domain-containing protein [Streptomyces sp. M19]
MRNLRETVRFEEATRALIADGHRVLVEVGPHPVLSTSLQETLGASAVEGVVVGTLRRGEGGARRVVASLAELFVWGCLSRGGRFRWSGCQSGRPAHVRVPAPAVLARRTGLGGRCDGAGLAPAEHPLLGAMVAVPGSGGMLFTGRMSVRSHPWLADHVVRGRWCFRDRVRGAGGPGGDAVGCGQVGELVLEAPLVIPAQGDCQIQVLLTEQVREQNQPEQRWTVAIHARPDGAEVWTRHATGVLTRTTGTGDASDGVVGTAWPRPERRTSTSRACTPQARPPRTVPTSSTDRCSRG